jgi:hypothetical protein
MELSYIHNQRRIGFEGVGSKAKPPEATQSYVHEQHNADLRDSKKEAQLCRSCNVHGLCTMPSVYLTATSNSRTACTAGANCMRGCTHPRLEDRLPNLWNVR